MNKILLSLTTCLCLLNAAHSQNGYDIRVTLKPYKNSKIYLGYYYGKVKAVADSTVLDENSTGHFSGKEKLTGGVYFIVSPSKTILFELLLDSQQHFSVAPTLPACPAAFPLPAPPITPYSTSTPSLPIRKARRSSPVRKSWPPSTIKRIRSASETR